MRLEIRWHVKVGDAIILRGLLRHLLKKFEPEEVCVPSSPEAGPTVRHLYDMDAREAGASLVVRSVDPANLKPLYQEPLWPDSLKVTVGAACPGFELPIWDRSFYKQAGVDPAERWKAYERGPDDFPPGVFLNRPEGNQRAFLMKQRRQGRRLIVFHETREKRIPHHIKARYMGRADCKCLLVSAELGSLLNWAPIFADADEMHMVDSGPANLANSIMAGGSRLTIYAQDTPPPSMLNPAAEGRVNVVCVGKWKPE